MYSGGQTYNPGMETAAASLARATRVEPRVRDTVLDNGLRVLVQEVHTAPLATVWCWYRVGSRDEGPGLTGVSHWVEHMNFKGTTHIPREQVKGIIERYGGYWNGYTWIDQTTYTETATRDALDHMLFIEAERMAHGLYDEADCESERTVIIAELQGGDNDPDQRLDQEVIAAAMQAHPYRHPTIGWLGDLESMTREDLYGHYRRFYTPDNATLVVAGDVDTDDVLRRAARHFDGFVSGGAGPRRYTREPDQPGERRVTIAQEGTAAYLKLAFHAPAWADPEFAPLLLLDAVLTGAKGLNLWASFRMPPPQRRARLYEALVDGGLAASVQGALMPTADPFLYSISMVATVDTPLARLEAAAIEALDRVRVGGITTSELARAKHQLRARMVFEGDSISNIAHQLGYFATLGGWQTFPACMARLDAVTIDEVHAAAASRLRPENRTVGWFDPR